MRGLVGVIGVFVVLVTACDESKKYAGLTESQAVALAKTRIESRLDRSKRAYYEISIWNIAAERAHTEDQVRVWLIGIWNGQAERGDCALVRRANGRDRVRLISCADFPKYARSAEAAARTETNSRF